MSETFHCPTCGAPLSIRNRFVKVVTCDFCGGVSLYDGARLDPTGRSVDLVKIPSPLYLDATGSIGGRAFRVLGRAIYEYDGGFWTEWFIEIEGAGRAWLIEDEGQFSALQTRNVSAPPFEGIRPGQTITVGDLEVQVDEVGEATVVGAEGQLGVEILPGDTIQYIDGSAGENEINIEYTETGIEVFSGRPVERSAIVIDDETY